MNIKDIYTFFPNFDRLLRISIEDHDVSEILPGRDGDEAPVICVYGITETEVRACLEAYAQEFESITEKIKGVAGADELWDVEIKPILLFDTLKTAQLFCDFANSLEYEQFCEMIDEMQRQYNTPWKSAELLDERITKKIIEEYSKSFSGVV